MMDDRVIENVELIGGSQDGLTIPVFTTCTNLYMGYDEKYRRVIRANGTTIFQAEALCQTME